MCGSKLQPITRVRAKYSSIVIQKELKSYGIEQVAQLGSGVCHRREDILALEHVVFVQKVIYSHTVSPIFMLRYEHFGLESSSS